MLKDLMAMLGQSQLGEQAWVHAGSALAASVASGGEPAANPDPLWRVAFDELVDVVVRQVELASEGVVRASVLETTTRCVGRVEFATGLFEQWRPLLAPLAAVRPKEVGHGADEMASLMAGLASTIGPSLVGMQYGSAAGHLATSALGASALPVAWGDARSITLCAENVADYAEAWSLPVDGARIFVLTREVTLSALRTLPHVGARIDRLVADWLVAQATNQLDVLDRLSDEAIDQEGLARLVADPESMLADLLAPSEHRFERELVDLTTLLFAYADQMAAQVTEALAGTGAAWREAWHRRRMEEGTDEQQAAALFGLDLSPLQVEVGRAFVDGVIERAGPSKLTELWWPAERFPTPAELEAPGLWLARIEL